MNNATFLSVQLNAEDFAGSSGLVELLNRHLLFATDVAEAADALDTLSGYDEAWLQALEPADALFRDIGRGPRPLH
ncbi:hypothetical protein [Burkholderia territorii]|uniref:hypothetical protein n=1 Tax=Burkholderia territorii TaxID=1503055 RepID=UPI0007B98E0C|nr:hypothetical protein [Burkholderia territorii]